MIYWLVEVWAQPLFLLPSVQNVKGKPITLNYFGDSFWHLAVLRRDTRLQTSLTWMNVNFVNSDTYHFQSPKLRFLQKAKHDVSSQWYWAELCWDCFAHHCFGGHPFLSQHGHSVCLSFSPSLCLSTIWQLDLWRIQYISSTYSFEITVF